MTDDPLKDADLAVQPMLMLSHCNLCAFMTSAVTAPALWAAFRDHCAFVHPPRSEH